MDIQTLQSFFGWCTILNIALMAFSGIMLAVAGDFVYRVHSSFYKIARDQFNVTIYGWLGTYKILIIVFCLVPWIALEIIG